MKLGWVGLGKLGLPCALVLASKGHQVIGYDPSPVPWRILQGENPGYEEAGLRALIQSTKLNSAESISDVVANSDIVFCAVQTPHAPAYGGEDEMPYDRVDFEYGYLAQAVRSVAQAAEQQSKPIILVVVSTVLPGTFNTRLRGLLNPYVQYVYNPFFIAMGTCVRDFQQPEFVLLGSEDESAISAVQAAYSPVHDRPFAVMSIESAELTKVSYNTFVSMKIVFANALMEICQKTGADVDQIVDALSLATDRVVSPAYMRGGMGDGGACHPRDNIAMSYLASKLQLSADPFEFVTRSREAQSWYLATFVKSWHEQSKLPVVILGQAYKPGIGLVNGSPAVLLKNQLNRAEVEVSTFDPYIDESTEVYDNPAVFVIGTSHGEFKSSPIPSGSIVIDPFGQVPDYPGSVVIRVGRKS